MFKEWGFLITEMILLLILAALLGLLVGWIVWGRRQGDGDSEAKVARLRADRDALKRAGLGKDRRIAELEASLAASNDKILSAAAALVKGGDIDVAPGAVRLEDDDADTVASVAPASLKKARDGTPDDLTRIKGIGPKLAVLCHNLGFYHYDQIAAWTPQEVAWVDANLEGFKGRVTRDEWVRQARALAEESR